MPGKKAAFVPQKCRLAGCSSKQTFGQLSTLKEHLVSKHDYDEEQIEVFMST